MSIRSLFYCADSKSNHSPPPGIISSAGAKYWWGSACDETGRIIAAIVKNGYIYLSVNYGQTWTELTNAGIKNWHSIDMSADGSVIVASVSMAISPADPNTPILFEEYIHTSKDFGQTWTTGNSTKQSWAFAAISNDGSTIIATTADPTTQPAKYIYKSIDYGETWSPLTNSGSRDWRQCSISADGQKMLAVTYGAGGIFTSTNGGITWANVKPGSSFLSCSSSSNMSTIIAAGQNMIPTISKNGGLTWSNTTLPSGLVISTTCSYDGATLSVGYFGGGLYISNDGGLTWAQNFKVGNNQWYRADSNSSGSVIIAPAFASDLYFVNT